MPSLISNFDVAVAVEDTPATPFADVQGSLWTTSNTGFLPGADLDAFPSPEVVDRELLTGKLTPARSIMGVKRGKFRMSHELLNDSRFLIGRLIRACGFRESQVCKIKVSSAGIKLGGSSTGFLRHGTRVYYGVPSGGSVSATQYFTVIGDYMDGDPVVFGTFAQNQGQKGSGGATSPAAGDTVSTDTNTAAGTAVTFVIDSSGYVDNGGRAYYPMSFPVIWIKFASADATADVHAGDILQGVTSSAQMRCLDTLTIAANTFVYGRLIQGTFQASEVVQNNTTNDVNLGALAASNFTGQDAMPTVSVGVYKDGPGVNLYACRGSFTLSFSSGKVPRFTFDLDGLVYADPQGCYDVTLPTGITKLSLTPQLFQNTSLQFGLDGSLSDYRPCVASLTLQVQNSINPRICSNSPSGVFEYLVTDRKVTGTLDPEVHLESQWPELAHFKNGDNVRLSWVCGSFVAGDNSQANNTWWFWVPRASITQEPGGERNKLAVNQVGFQANTGSTSISSVAIDNDCIIICDRVPGQWSLTI